MNKGIALGSGYVLLIFFAVIAIAKFQQSKRENEPRVIVEVESPIPITLKENSLSHYEMGGGNNCFILRFKNKVSMSCVRR